MRQRLRATVWSQPRKLRIGWRGDLHDQLLEELHDGILGIGPVAQVAQRHAVDQLRVAEVERGEVFRTAVGAVAGQQLVVARKGFGMFGGSHGGRYRTVKLSFFSDGLCIFCRRRILWMQQLLKIHTFNRKKMAFMRPFLKNSILAALLVAATCAAAQPAGGVSASEEPSAREATDRRIARLDEAIRQVELTRNRLMWNTYLDYAEQGRITPDVMDYPGLDYERLRDTVPAIDTLGCRYTAAAEAYTQVLRTDPEYEAIHQEYVALKGVSDRDRQAENKMRYNLLYDRLRRNNPDYVPAWERMNEAKRQRNMGILRYLVESHAAAGRVLPTDPLFRKISMVYTMLRNRCPEIARLDVELDALCRMRRELWEAALRERYGVPEP